MCFDENGKRVFPKKKMVEKVILRTYFFRAAYIRVVIYDVNSFGAKIEEKKKKKLTNENR